MIQSTTTTANSGFEAALSELQGIVKKMESGELSLEESLQAFEQGVKLTRQCSAELASAERKVELLTQPQNTSQAQLAPFNSEA